MTNCTYTRTIRGNDVDWQELPDHVGDISVYDTLPKLLAYNAKVYGEDIAQREKDFGIWESVTWSEFNGHVGRITLGLSELGISPGDTIAIIGDNRREWVWAEIAAHACRAMSLGIYRDALEKEILFLIDYTKPTVIFAEDEEQVDKFLELGDRIASVKHIIYHDGRGMRKYEDPRLMALEDLEAVGTGVLDASPSRYKEMVAATKGDEVAILCTTSGTTSNPKLAKWRHDSFLGHAVNYLRADPRSPDDEYLAVLPLSWVMEQMYSVAWNLLARMKVSFPEEEHTAMSDLREVGPNFVLLSPRVWEVVAADVRARNMDASKWKRAIYNWGVRVGPQAIEARKPVGLAEYVLFRALRDRLGFSELKSAATGGAAMGPDTFKFFQAMGIPLKQLYGQTEALGAYVIHMHGDVDYESVGKPMPDCEIKIKDPDSEGLGEILVRHPHMMSGYYQNEKETKAVFDEEGWFLTGDAGYLNKNDELIVVDRVADLSVTSLDVKFSPQFIENKLKFSTYVAEAVILGKDQPHLTAMICIRYSIVSKWAEDRRINFTTYSDLAAKPEVYALLREEVERVNKSLPAQQQIQSFVLLYKELDADDGELTRTKKVRRGVIAKQYGEIIETIYSGRDDVDIDTVISFQDGSSQRVVTTLKIEKLKSEAKEVAA